MKRLLFYRQLYTSPAIRYPAAVKWHLNHDADNPALYIITLCDETLCREGSSHSVSHSGELYETDQAVPSFDGIPGSSGQIEFFHCSFLRQRWIREHCPMIIGVAEGRWEAVELVRRIVEDTWRKTGSLDIVAYLASVDSRIQYVPASQGNAAPQETGSALSDIRPDRSSRNPKADNGRAAEGGMI